MEFDYICIAIDNDDGQQVEVKISAPSKYRAKILAKVHCDNHDLEFVSIELDE